MANMNFDPVADRYDQTRVLPSGIAEQIRDCIVSASHATEDTRFLEPGIGTGRIALPFVLAGYHYTGIDISERMMDRLRAKLDGNMRNLTLLTGDVADLPFPDDSFDVTVVVHLLHLVPQWREALAEIRRVTVPHGWLALSGNSTPPGQIPEIIRRHWYEYVASQGSAPTRRHSQLSEVQAELTAQGCIMHEYHVARWENQMRPMDILHGLRDRLWSQTWSLSDEALMDAYEHTLAWSRAEFGDLDRQISVPEEFLVTMCLWPDT